MKVTSLVSPLLLNLDDELESMNEDRYHSPDFHMGTTLASPRYLNTSDDCAMPSW